MHKINWNTHCSLPWVRFDSRSQSVCCKNKIPSRFQSFDELSNSHDINQLRTDLLNGVKNPWCQECWDEEDAGKESMRRVQLHRDGLQKSEEYLNDEIINHGLRELILDSGNSCNLACRTCGGHSSSTHIIEDKSKKSKFPNLTLHVVHRTNTDRLLKEDYSKTYSIEVLGGEPFLNLDHFKVLEKVIATGHAKNCTVTYTTNCTQKISNKHLKIISEFFSVGFILSIDAIGDQFEYIRTGGHWDDVLENIKILREVPNAYFLVHPTVSVFNILYLEELYDWIIEQNFPVYYDFCFNPRQFSFEVLTEQQKQEIIDYLLGSKHNMNPIIDYLKKVKHSPDLISLFWKEIEWTKEYHNMDITQVLPKLANLLT